MGSAHDPRNVTWTTLGSFGELWSLCLWWAMWSIADRYLLRYTPSAELGVIGGCLLIAVLQRWIRCCVGKSHRYARKLNDTPYGSGPINDNGTCPAKRDAELDAIIIQ